MIDDLLREERVFHPPEDFVQKARVTTGQLHQQADENSERYWEEQAKELHWFQPWQTVMDWNPPHVQWFTGGKLNICYNCLDRHLSGPRRHKAAIVWEGEEGEQKTFTYLSLHREVCKFAHALQNKLGIQLGDRVAIYMPMIPEAIIAMLACARIGAIHSVVFAGFSSDSLADRINDSECKLLITADGCRRRGKVIPLKSNADQALEQCPSIENVVVVRAIPTEDMPNIEEGRDHWYHHLMDHDVVDCPAVEMDAEDPLFILYTSGTTGKPKGIVHTTGGYAVGAQTSCKYVFDMRDDDMFWCTADVGWITGHSYIVYGPLLCAATVLVYEGSPDYPDKDRFWRLIDDHQVSIFYTAPTAIRTFMKWGAQYPKKYRLDSLRLLGSVGEPINPEAWMWYYTHIGRENAPIVDTWWQTETGSIMISGLPGLNPMRPGYAGKALPGVAATILDEDGKEIWDGSGLLAIMKPWPSIARTIWGDDERYIKTYFSKWNSSVYFPGDGAKRAADNYMMVLGRIDDVLNVSGHRISTMEVESALVDHPSVAEAAVVGKTHDIKGQGIVAFVTLKADVSMHSNLQQEIKEHVANKIGSLARPEDICFTADLPKTRSGKIMRRLLKDVAEGRVLGDITTLADASVVENLRRTYEAHE